MGMIRLFSGSDDSSCSCSCQVRTPFRKLPNPDPWNFRIIRTEHTRNFTVAEVEYPDCTNFEGRKIMLLGVGKVELKTLRRLDPHFEVDGDVIARYVPNDAGWDMARNAMRDLQEALDQRRKLESGG